MIDTVFTANLSISQRDDPLDKFNIPTWAMVAAEDFWVDALSAGIGVPDGQKHTVRGSHGSIIQPHSKDGDTYKFLRDSLETCFGPQADKLGDGEDILVEDARPEDVANIRNLAISFFGEDVTPESALVEFAVAGGILQVVKRVLWSGYEKRERFSGYFCIIPLSTQATALVRAGTLRGGALTVNHGPANPKETAALYIGAVAARDHFSRAVVLEAMRWQVRYSAALGVKEVLTRPLTRDGLRLVRRHHFRPLRGHGGLEELYALDSATFSAVGIRQN
jgi:hypothetical protein